MKCQPKDSCSAINPFIINTRKSLFNAQVGNSLKIKQRKREQSLKTFTLRRQDMPDSSNDREGTNE